ncbi:MAG TPA: ATP-binding cassette domain-containing protein [Terracidiphilus sp.]|nr:ATP-binding cassette domain-containing protein [Terracidiphilus sp.]
MLELQLEARRGGFHLQMECRFAAEWTVVFGPSGSGKSTLLRMVAGLDRPDRGRIALDEQVLTDTDGRVFHAAGARRTVLVAQHAALFPHLSVRANVAFGVAHLGQAEREARVQEMLALVDAKELVERSPRSLSGGEAQRVALARALATEPRLLLLDEPFAALDGAASDELLERLQQWLRARKMQAVMVTHDATDAYATGAEVALLHEGKLAAVGPAGAALAGEKERILGRLRSS